MHLHCFLKSFASVLVDLDDISNVGSTELESASTLDLVFSCVRHRLFDPVLPIARVPMIQHISPLLCTTQLLLTSAGRFWRCLKLVYCLHRVQLWSRQAEVPLVRHMTGDLSLGTQ